MAVLRPVHNSIPAVGSPAIQIRDPGRFQRSNGRARNATAARRTAPRLSIAAPDRSRPERGISLELSRLDALLLRDRIRLAGPGVKCEPTKGMMDRTT